MSLEVELKLTLTEAMTPALAGQIEQVLTSLAQHCQPMPASQLLNAYFDTAAQWFRQHDSGLRSRLKQGRYEQTIKLAGQQHGGAHIRPEYNLPCDSVIPQLSAFPAQIWPTGTDIALLQQQLQELFRTDFIRQGWLLTLADGTVVEAVLDQGQVLAADQCETILELELELVQGNAEMLFSLAQQLIRQLPLQLGFQSKAERGYRLAQQQPLQLQQSPADASLSQILRAVQQNLSLQQQATSVDARQAATKLLQQQQSALQLSLAQAAAEPELAATMPDVASASQSELASWLLQLSCWMYQQSQQGG